MQIKQFTKKITAAQNQYQTVEFNQRLPLFKKKHFLYDNISRLMHTFM
jgi:hypothetical protein